MDIEIKLDEKYSNSKIIIYTNKMNEEISNILETFYSINKKNLKAYDNGKLFILLQDNVETIYSENGKVYARSNNKIYTIKDRLYKLEEFLDKQTFIRISNSEIINFNKVKNIDFKILGTLVINFKSGNKAYASRRYIPKIKSFLEI